MTYTNFDRVAYIYDKTRSIPSEILTSFREKILNFLSKYEYKPPYNFLSIGVGTGRVESTIVSKRNQLFGIDISNLMLKELKKKRTETPIFLAIADGCSIPFRNSFHMVIAIHVVQLIKNYKKLIKEIENISQFAVIGDAFVDSYVHPLFQRYKSELEKLGWKKRHEGLFSDEFAGYLSSEGYLIEKDEIFFPTTISNSAIYNSLKQKQYSSQWKIPENLHNRTMKILQESIQNKEIRLENDYLTNAYLLLYFVDLREKLH